MKILKIAWKDFKITYRDITALLLMVAAPLAMTLVMAFAFGTSSGSGFTVIPVALVSNGSDSLSQVVEDILTSEQIQEYLAVQKFSDIETAQKELDRDKFAAVIVVPEGTIQNFEAMNDFSGDTPIDLTQTITIYTNPTRPISAMIVEAILDSITTRLNAGFAGAIIGFSDLLKGGSVSPQALTEGLGEDIGQNLAPIFEENESQISLEVSYWESNGSDEFSWMAYMAPSMSILFLSFSMTASARTILSEKEKGTFGRLLTSPTRSLAIIVGKMLGIYLIGVIQVFAFIVLSSFILNLSWGPLPVLIIFTLSLVLGSASWGILVASLAKNSGQASALGMAVNLVFAAVAGNFVPRVNYPQWLKDLGVITPNAWGIEGFMALINGGGLHDVRTAILVLTAMAVILISIATFLFTWQYGQIRILRKNHA
jgi:ABC-2 type transport system permease protein